jgi:plasmid maintenance system antidote protein VapI
VKVAERLKRDLITKPGRTVTDVAFQLGMSRPAFSNVLHGSADLSIQLAFKLEAVFGLNAKRLLTAQLTERVNEYRRSKATGERANGKMVW